MYRAGNCLIYMIGHYNSFNNTKEMYAFFVSKDNFFESKKHNFVFIYTNPFRFIK